MHTGPSCGHRSGEGRGVTSVQSLLRERSPGGKHAGVHGTLRAPECHQRAGGGGETHTPFPCSSLYRRSFSSSLSDEAGY